MRNDRKSKKEWMELIHECRAGGMTASAWCELRSIPRKSYSNALSRLVREGLPMPVEVGNAIYSYLKYGRPDTESDFIFVRSKAPYGRLTGKELDKVKKPPAPKRSREREER